MNFKNIRTYYDTKADMPWYHAEDVAQHLELGLEDLLRRINDRWVGDVLESNFQPRADPLQSQVSHPETRAIAPEARAIAPPVPGSPPLPPGSYPLAGGTPPSGLPNPPMQWAAPPAPLATAPASRVTTPLSRANPQNSDVVSRANRKSEKLVPVLRLAGLIDAVSLVRGEDKQARRSQFIEGIEESLLADFRRQRERAESAERKAKVAEGELVVEKSRTDDDRAQARKNDLAYRAMCGDRSAANALAPPQKKSGW